MSVLRSWSSVSESGRSTRRLALAIYGCSWKLLWRLTLTSTAVASSSSSSSTTSSSSSVVPLLLLLLVVLLDVLRPFPRVTRPGACRCGAAGSLRHPLPRGGGHAAGRWLLRWLCFVVA